jgi:hypothetical protein
MYTMTLEKLSISFPSVFENLLGSLAVPLATLTIHTDLALVMYMLFSVQKLSAVAFAKIQMLDPKL